MIATDPPLLHPPYRSTRRRAPLAAPIAFPATAAELDGPRFGAGDVRPEDADLTRQHDGEPIGPRIIVAGRVVDEHGRPVPHALIEIWQANAAGRYRHDADDTRAPLDPCFSGAGRALTDDAGGYRFLTVRPGPYPWRNHPNAWRPAHIHVSVIGPSLRARLVTQMYFEGDPLLPHDPIFTSVPDAEARAALVAPLDWALCEDQHALGYRFDIVLRGVA
jgi:protocatechuate 3,4-dioxygenase beta subunit